MNTLPEFGTRYNQKIRTAEELLDILGPRPREQNVILCHGVFDVVHPGHLRHLIFAKSKADVLIASLTSDRHIAKGTFRPHVPQDLRAINLAALEVVDYVLIDPNETPIENLRTLQPDFFAKGYEYTGNGPNPRTREEAETVSAYGGEMLFTPGDIVYSSSRLIEVEPPNLRIEKLMVLMSACKLSFDRLRSSLTEFKKFRIHVVGDTIVDTISRCSMTGGQAKTPTLSVVCEERRDYIGGAAIVAAHIRAAGAEVEFSTVLGDDALKQFVLGELHTAGVATHAITDATRRTTNKNAIVADGYRLLKLDTLDNHSISDEIQDMLAARIANVKSDAVVFSDFRHGVFNRRTIPTLVDALPSGVMKVADSQVASRWGNITDFQNFDLITPNEREARFALADQDSGIRPLASRLYDAANCKTLILKLGGRGVITSHSKHEKLDSYFVVDSFVDNLADAVGAGDALLSYATLAMLATNDTVIATIIGSLAAAVECECDGNEPVKQEDVFAKIASVERIARYER